MTARRPNAGIDAARAALERGDLAAAEAACRRLVARDKRDVNAWQILGLVHNRRGWFDKSVPCFERIVKLVPNDPRPLCQLASARMYQGRFDDAERGFDRALAMRPGEPAAVRGKAELLERRGDAAGALALLAPVAERHPSDPELALLHATLLERTGAPEPALERAEAMLARPAVQPQTRRKLAFVTGRAYDRLGRHDEAFVAYGRANAIDARPFDFAQEVARHDRLMEIFAPHRIAALPRASAPTNLPVFVVGLPRSGSTLVEQIIDAHPKAFGAGELTTFTDLVAEIPAKLGVTDPYPEWIEALPPDRLDRLGRGYPNALARMARGAERVADKNLLNATHLGLISLLYPGSRAIHCRRDPVAGAVSCFMNDLSPVGFPWSTDLENIGRHFREHDRLMGHWRRTLDYPILEVSYEALVDDVETGARAIIDFCDLPWDDACLRFHETGRAVTTLSYDQVRRPIYRTALTRHERYGSRLDPLRAALAGG